MAINSAVNIPRSTLTRAVEIILDIKPLHLQVREVGLATYARLGKTLERNWCGEDRKGSKVSYGHLKYWEVESEGLELSMDECDKNITTRSDKTYKVNLDSLKGRYRREYKWLQK